MGAAEVTMPHERARALRWGGEFLQEACNDPSVDISLRAEAIELQRIYPLPAVVLDWIDSDAPCIPAAAAVAIEGTATLLALIVRSSACSSELRRSAKFALRHFPEPGTAERWTVAVRHWSIREWLLREDTYNLSVNNVDR